MTHAITPNPLHRIASLMADNRERTAADVANIVGLSPRGAGRYMRQLADSGILRAFDLKGANAYRSAKAPAPSTDKPTRSATPPARTLSDADALFARMWEAGVSADDIARHMGYAHANSIGRRRRALMLEPRARGRNAAGHVAMPLAEFLAAERQQVAA